MATTLDLIERLSPLTVIPGHDSVFADAASALSRVRSRLAKFVNDPIRHARYGAKALLKYKLLEWQRCGKAQLFEWTEQTPYFGISHQRFFKEQALKPWFQSLLADLQRSKAVEIYDDVIINLD